MVQLRSAVAASRPSSVGELPPMIDRSGDAIWERHDHPPVADLGLGEPARLDCMWRLRLDRCRASVMLAARIRLLVSMTASRRGPSAIAGIRPWAAGQRRRSAGLRWSRSSSRRGPGEQVLQRVPRVFEREIREAERLPGRWPREVGG